MEDFDKRFHQSITDLKKHFDEFHLREEIETYLGYSMEYASDQEDETVFLVVGKIVLPVF